MIEKYIPKFINALISGQVALHHFEQLTHTPFYRQRTKNKLNLIIEELLRNEEVFEAIQKEAENPTDDVHDSFFEMIRVITKVPFEEARNLSLIVQAYQKDPKRMEQITKKILEQ